MKSFMLNCDKAAAAFTRAISLSSMFATLSSAMLPLYAEWIFVSSVKFVLTRQPDGSIFVP